MTPLTRLVVIIFYSTCEQTLTFVYIMYYMLLFSDIKIYFTLLINVWSVIYFLKKIIHQTL